MTKKTVLAAAMIFALMSTVNAQKNVMYFVNDSVPEQKIRKNEIGLNIAPIASMLLGASPYAPKLTLTYKRYYKEKKAWRISGSYQVFQQEALYNFNNFEIIEQTDTTQLRRYSQHNYRSRTQLGIGREWRWGKRKLKYFSGADVILGYTSRRYSQYDQGYFLEQGYGFTYGSNDTLYHYVIDPGTHSDITTDKTDIFYAGASPFFGISYALSNKITLTAQASLDVTFAYCEGVKKDHVSGTNTQYFYTTLEFSTPGLISDLSLFFRF